MCAQNKPNTYNLYKKGMMQFTEMTVFPWDGIFTVLYQLILLQHHNTCFSNMVVENTVWYLGHAWECEQILQKKKV